MPRTERAGAKVSCGFHSSYAACHEGRSFPYCASIEEMRMVSDIKKTTVKGGYLARSAKTGRFVEVWTSSGATKAGPKTISVVKGASDRRKSALKRLADR